MAQAGLNLRWVQLFKDTFSDLTAQTMINVEAE